MIHISFNPEPASKLLVPASGKAAELLGSMAEREDDGWRFTLWDESASQIIKAVVVSGDSEALRLVREAASRAAARGHSQWLEYLEKP